MSASYNGIMYTNNKNINTNKENNRKIINKMTDLHWLTLLCGIEAHSTNN